MTVTDSEDLAAPSVPGPLDPDRAQPAMSYTPHDRVWIWLGAYWYPATVQAVVGEQVLVRWHSEAGAHAESVTAQRVTPRTRRT